MMENFPLPEELRQLERRLAARERAQPLPEAKERFLCSVRAELRRSQARGRWAFAAAMAATVLVWLNLSLCATRATDFGLEPGGPPQLVENEAERIRELLPDLPPREAVRQAVLLRASSGVIPCPKLAANDFAMARNDVGKELLD